MLCTSCSVLWVVVVVCVMLCVSYCIMYLVDDGIVLNMWRVVVYFESICEHCVMFVNGVVFVLCVSYIVVCWSCACCC